MRTEEVLSTIRWIRQQFEPIQKFIFEDFFAMLGRDKPPDPSAFAGLHSSGVVFHTIRQNPLAVEVLTHFHLKKLIEENFFPSVFSQIIISSRDDKPIQEMHTINRRWMIMMGCVLPLTGLTLPAELQNPEGNENLIIIDLTDRPELKTDSVTVVLKATANLYDALAKLYGYPQASPLTIVKIESGTGLRISLKGAAEIVKEFKNFMVTAWHTIRHRKADDIINNNKAVVSGIQVLALIEEKERKGLLGPEEGQRLKRAILHNTFTLFEDGALITDIPATEFVDNYKLLEGFTSPKLLLAASNPSKPTEPSESSGPKQKRSVRKKKTLPPDVQAPAS